VWIASSDNVGYDDLYANCHASDSLHGI
jgi:hypothetical protein